MDSLPSTSNSILESELAQDAGDFEQVYHLRRLYRQVLHFYKRQNEISDQSLSDAISDVIDSFKYGDGHRFEEVDFNRTEMCCGFIFRYAAHDAGLARCRILKGLRQCKELKPILGKKQVKVVSLGCGPGSDAIGFCSAMSRLKFQGTLKILMTDSISNWRDYAHKVVKLLSLGGFGEASDLFQGKKVECSFSRCTLPGQLSNLTISNYDVILMCKLMSIMTEREKGQLPSELYREMNESALLLFIDVPFDRYRWRNHFEILYTSPRLDQDYESGDKHMRYLGIYHDYVVSKSRIAVLRKRKICW